ADLERLYATTARHRDMTAVELTPRRAAVDVRAHASKGARSGLIFGRERIGLTNDEVTRCDAMVVAPLNPAFTSLNLAQAVLLIGWEWRTAADTTPERVFLTPDTRPAKRSEYESFFNRLEASLESTAFFRDPHLRPILWRKVRGLFHRAELTEQEVRILHGVLSALDGKRQLRLKSVDAATDPLPDAPAEDAP
ncbi:MAG: TrmH family RNA methyltransferase, partial [Acidobacteriota bacterium]